MASHTDTEEDRAFNRRVTHGARNRFTDDTDRLDYEDWEYGMFPTTPDPLEASMGVEQIITQQYWDRLLGH